MKKVQKEIIARYHGIQPVGTALTVPINEKTILIHVPTMYYPEPIYDQRVVFKAMHVTLCEAEQQNVSSIVIPAFGGATGKIQPRVIAYLMRTAYDYYMHPIKEIDWDKAVLLEESFYRLAVAMLEKNKAETAAQELDSAADTLYS